MEFALHKSFLAMLLFHGSLHFNQRIKEINPPEDEYIDIIDIISCNHPMKILLSVSRLNARVDV